MSKEVKEQSGFSVAMRNCLNKTGQGLKKVGLGLHKGFYTNGNRSLLSSVICALMGILIGFLIMLIALAVPSVRAVAHPWQALGSIFAGPFTGLNPLKDFGNMLFRATPLIFTGLSVAIAYKTGLFNIGAPGQFLIGSLLSQLIALTIDSYYAPRVQGVFVWLLAVLVGTIGGILWGLIPGALKAFFGINEVIVSIMTNWIAANMVTWVFSAEGLVHLHNDRATKSAFLINTDYTGNYTPTIGLGKLFGGSYLDIGIIIAIIAAIAVWFLLNKTTLGYSMKATGLNKFAAKYAGINDKANIMISMGIAGGLAALGGCFYYLNPGVDFPWERTYQILPSYGFDGISAAFLANCNPIGVIFSSIFIRYILSSGNSLEIAGYNHYFGDIITAVIIYLAAFSKYTQGVLGKYMTKMKVYFDAKFGLKNSDQYVNVNAGVNGKTASPAPEVKTEEKKGEQE